MEFIDLLTLLAALLFVLALMIGFGWAFKRYGGSITGMSGGKDKHIKVIDTLLLDPRRKMYLLQTGQKHYVVLTGPNGDVIVDNDAKPDLDLDSHLSPPHDKDDENKDIH